MYEWKNEFIYQNKNKWLNKANRHDGAIWQSEIRLIVVYFKPHDYAFGKGDNVKIVPCSRPG